MVAMLVSQNISQSLQGTSTNATSCRRKMEVRANLKLAFVAGWHSVPLNTRLSQLNKENSNVLKIPIS